MPDSLGFGSRQRPEHPRPASTRLPNNRQHAACAAPSLHPTRFLPNKSPPSIPHPHSQAALFPTPRPGPGNSQPAIRPLRQFPTPPPAQAFTSRTRNTHKLPQAPLPPSERPAILRASGNPPSAQQSSEHPAILQTRPLLSPPNARPHRRSDTPAPEIPNTARHPEIPKFLPASRNTKKRSRHCAGSAPNYLQVSTRSYLSRSESGSGSCSSPYC